MLDVKVEKNLPKIHWIQLTQDICMQSQTHANKKPHYAKKFTTNERKNTICIEQYWE